MVSLQQSTLGRTVYGQGSYAPTRGPVSGAGSMGYVQRELRRTNGVSTTGADGQSDTRSGNAAAALSRKRKLAGPGGRPIMPGTKALGSYYNPGRPLIKNPKAPGHGPVFTTPHGAAGNGNVPSGPHTGTVGQIPQEVSVNSAGVLELPYSQNWSQSLLDNLAKYNTQLMDLQTQQQQGELAYAKNTRDAQQQYGDLKLQTLNQNAGNGTAFSTAYGTAVGKNATAYNNQINDLDSGESALESSIFNQRSNIKNSFNDQLRNEVLNYAGETSQYAGSLGYGHGTPQVHPDQNPVKAGPRHINVHGYNGTVNVGGHSYTNTGRPRLIKNRKKNAQAAATKVFK